jgi:hypothetical protein
MFTKYILSKRFVLFAVMSISENYKYVKSNDDNNLSNGMAAHFL